MTSYHPHASEGRGVGGGGCEGGGGEGESEGGGGEGGRVGGAHQCKGDETGGDLEGQRRGRNLAKGGQSCVSRCPHSRYAHPGGERDKRVAEVLRGTERPESRRDGLAGSSRHTLAAGVCRWGG